MKVLRCLIILFPLWLLACSDDASTPGPDAADTGGDGVIDGGDAGPDLVDDTSPDVRLDVAVDVTTDLVDDPPHDAPTEADHDPDVLADVAPDTVADGGDLGDVVEPDLVADSDDAGPCAPKPPIDDSGPYVRVGVGFAEYEEVDNCDNVAWILGIQGGAHIWGAFQAGGFDTATDVFFHIDFEFEQGGEVIAVANYVDTIRFAGDPDGGPYLYDSVTVILDESREPEDHLDVPGVLRLHLWREGGVDLRDEVILIPNEVTFP